MILYEIDQQIENLIDAETGEILDFEAFAELQMERERKLENIALWVKELEAQTAAIKAEEQNLAVRRKSLEKRAERLKTYLGEFLAGEKFQTARTNVTFRKSTTVEFSDVSAFVMDADVNHKEWLTYAAPTINKTAVKTALKNGEEVPGAALVDHQNIQIK